MTMARVRSGDRQPDTLDTPFLEDCDRELGDNHAAASLHRSEASATEDDDDRDAGTQDVGANATGAGGDAVAGDDGDAGTKDVGAEATGARGDAGITDDSDQATDAEKNAALHDESATATKNIGKKCDQDTFNSVVSHLTNPQGEYAYEEEDASAKGAADAKSPPMTATLLDATQQFGETYRALDGPCAEIKHTSMDSWVLARTDMTEEFAKVAGAALTAVADSVVQQATSPKESDEALTEAAVAASRPNRTSGGVCATGSVLDIVHLGPDNCDTPRCLKCASIVDPFKAIIKTKRKESMSYICRPCNSISTMTTRTVGALPEIAGMSASETVDFFKEAAATADSSGRFNWTRIRGVLISNLTRSVRRIQSAKEHGEFLPLSVWKARGFDPVVIASGGDRMQHPVLGEVFRVKLLSTTDERIEITIRDTVLKAEATLKGVKKDAAGSSTDGTGSGASSSADPLPVGALMVESSDEEPSPKRTRVQGAAGDDVASRIAALAASLQQFSTSPAGVGSPGTAGSGNTPGSGNSPTPAAGNRGGRRRTVDPAVAAAAEQQRIARQLAKDEAAEARKQQQLQKAAAREITKSNAKIINLAQRTATSLGHLATTAEQSLRVTKDVGIPDYLKKDLEQSKTEAKRMLKVAQTRLSQSAKATSNNLQLDSVDWVAEDVTALVKKLKDSKM